MAESTRRGRQVPAIIALTMIEAGDKVVISAKSKRYSFDQPVIIRSVYEEINDADFVTTNFR